MFAVPGKRADASELINSETRTCTNSRYLNPGPRRTLNEILSSTI